MEALKHTSSILPELIISSQNGIYVLNHHFVDVFWNKGVIF